jgi:hypothetical protein
MSFQVWNAAIHKSIRTIFGNKSSDMTMSNTIIVVGDHVSHEKEALPQSISTLVETIPEMTIEFGLLRRNSGQKRILRLIHELSLVPSWSRRLHKISIDSGDRNVLKFAEMRSQSNPMIEASNMKIVAGV